MRKIDGQSAAKVRATLHRCERNASDPVRALDELGLLRYPATDLEVQTEMLHLMAGMLESLTVKQLATVQDQRMPTTALDTKNVIVAWMRGQARQLQAAQRGEGS